MVFNVEDIDTKRSAGGVWQRGTDLRLKLLRTQRLSFRPTQPRCFSSCRLGRDVLGEVPTWRCRSSAAPSLRQRCVDPAVDAERSAMAPSRAA
ncbi:hypothetical protein AOLI_G00211760 [Acnodon oligacanthus]